MANLNLPQTKQDYDPRWFIWTIVFLVVSGISLVSYIVFSDSGNDSVSPLTVSRSAAQKNK